MVYNQHLFTTVLVKIWSFLATRVLTLKVFDLVLQGALLIVILLEHNALLLLRRAADKYQVTMFIEGTFNSTSESALARVVF
jgi:hypothetical protein